MIRTFTLPLPPSVNQLYPGKIRRHKSDKYYAWELEAAVVMRAQYLPQWEHSTTKHHWKLRIDCYMGSWLGDMSNTLKAGEDFIAGWFKLDDRYDVEITMVRHVSKEPRWEVTLEIIGA